MASKDKGVKAYYREKKRWENGENCNSCRRNRRRIGNMTTVEVKQVILLENGHPACRWAASFRYSNGKTSGVVYEGPTRKKTTAMGKSMAKQWDDWLAAGHTPATEQQNDALGEDEPDYSSMGPDEEEELTWRAKTNFWGIMLRGIKAWKSQVDDRPSDGGLDFPDDELGVFFPLAEANRLQRARRLILRLSNTRHPADMHEIWKPIDKLAREWNKPKRKICRRKKV
jgi:hypothetical protein